MRLLVAIALGRWEQVRALRKNAPAGEPDRQWRELVLMAHLFAGIPRQIEAYEVLAHAGGLGALEPDEALHEPDLPQRGKSLFDQIYGANSETVRLRISNHHPDFGDWVAGHAYGRVLTRPGLSAKEREICAVAVLAAMEQDRQLAGHVRGAIHCGANHLELEAALIEASDFIRPEALQRAQVIVQRFAHPKT